MGKRNKSSVIAADIHAAGERKQNLLVATSLVVMVLAVLRSFVVVFPELYWDVDPRSPLSSQVIIGIGPLGVAWLDLLSVLAAAGAMWVHHHAGGKLAWMSSLLAIVGGVFCLWQLPRYGPGMLTAGAWVAAMALAVAAYHLAQHKRARLVMTAVLAALIIPWLLKSIVYVYWDHAMTLQMFLKDEAQSVAAHGWKFGSPQHLLFKRRLEFPDVTGSFGLSNVYGSVVAAVGMISAGLAAVLLRDQRWKHAALPVALWIMSLITVYYTNSKGAAVAMVMGLGLLGLIVLAWRWKTLGRLVAPAAMVCVLLAIGLVLARGAMGPPDSDQGERSLLFRYQYWEASMRMIAHEPWREKIMGVGPGAFKESYILYKNPLSPEEVTSSHNVTIDFVTMLGAGGVAWSVLLMAWLWAAGQGAGAWAGRRETSEASSDTAQSSQRPGLNKTNKAEPADAHEAGRQMDRDVKVAVIAAAALFGFQFYTQLGTMLVAEQFLSWAMGAVGFIAVVVLLGNERWTRAGAAQMALFLGAAVLLIHNQIEMSFFNQQASTLAFVVVAAAAGAAAKCTSVDTQTGEQTDDSFSSTDAGEAGFKLTGSTAMMLVLLAGAVVMWATYVLPTQKQQAALSQAAVLLRGNQQLAAIKLLDDAIQAMPRDPRPYDSKLMLLVEAGRYFAEQKQTAVAKQLMSQAMATLDAAYAAGLDEVSLLRRRAQLLEDDARVFNEPERVITAINVWQRVMERSPYSIRDAMHLADLLWNQGRHDEARKWYARTLELDRDNYLDPAKQLLPEQKAQVEARLVKAEL